nr:MAG TPA: hypothetical protein [Caudoviricetes sp.]
MHHFCDHSVAAQSMINFIHFHEIFVSIRWNVTQHHVFIMILDQLDPEQQHGTFTVRIPVSLLVFQEPDDVSQKDWECYSICLR